MKGGPSRRFNDHRMSASERLGVAIVYFAELSVLNVPVQPAVLYLGHKF